VADRKPAAALDQLAALNELELIDSDPLADLDRLVLLAADICGADLACFTVHDGTTAHEVSSSFGPRATMPKLECMCSIPLASGETLQAFDAAADLRLAAKRYVSGAPFVRSFVGVPVVMDAGSPGRAFRPSAIPSPASSARRRSSASRNCRTGCSLFAPAPETAIRAKRAAERDACGTAEARPV